MSRVVLCAALLLGATASHSSKVYGQSNAASLSIESPSIRVLVYNDEGVPPEHLFAAQRIVDAILRRAGLQATWQDCTIGYSNRDSSLCDMDLAHGYVLLYLVAKLEAHAPNVGRSAFGYSIIPDDGARANMAYVCYGRVRRVVTSFGAEEVLGLAMAHEIGHLLLGTRTHSSSGLMRATWGKKELKAWQWEEFSFTTDQAKQLRAAIQERMVLAERTTAIHTQANESTRQRVNGQE